MPRRTRIELAEVAAWPNLEAALWAAARGKRARPDVAAFLADAQRNLVRVREALLDGRLPDGRLRSFAIRDPKPRIIHAAPFPDRVAHHALVHLLEPRLEQALVPTSFACRPGAPAQRPATVSCVAAAGSTTAGTAARPTATATSPATATTTSASGWPERLPPVAGKPSRGTRALGLLVQGANRKGAGAPVGPDPNVRRCPALFGALF